MPVVDAEVPLSQAGSTAAISPLLADAAVVAEHRRRPTMSDRRADPDHQGGGIGSALVKLGLARAAEDGIPAYLEAGNPRNVPLYERLGFKVIAEADAPDGGPHIWFMRCDLQQAATGS